MIGLIWDIQEEHLDEAEFLLEMWCACADSPRFTLDRLIEGPEERLLARIDGLVVGGAQVVEALLLPLVLEARGELRTAAATWAIVQGPSLEACAQVLASLDETDSVDGRRGLVLGLTHARRAGLIPWLGRDIDHREGPGLAARLDVLAAHRVDAGPRLSLWLQSEQLEVRRAAARLARYTADEQPLHYLGPAARSSDHELRWAAIESGLIRGLPGAWELVCVEALAPAAEPPPHRRTALAWVAQLGDEAARQRLLDTLLAGPTAELLWASSLSGRLHAVEAALELIEHPRLARLAGEVVCAIAGMPADDERLWLDRGRQVGDDEDQALPTLDDDPLDAELTPTNEDFLRLPNPDEVRFWWARRAPQLDPNLRHLAGRPLDAATLVGGLRRLPTRRRHPLALELAARTRGRTHLSTRSLGAVQLAQLAQATEALGAVDLQRGFALPS